MSELEGLLRRAEGVLDAIGESLKPKVPWVMNQRWGSVLMIHWRLPYDTVRPLVPAQLELDAYEDGIFVSLLPLHMEDVHYRGLPPIVTKGHFPELNLRTYVRGPDGEAGVYFLSIDAGTGAGSWVARHVFKLPYNESEMTFEQQGGGFCLTSERPRSEFAPAARFAVHWRPTGELRAAAPGSREAFLAERYWVYTVDQESGHVYHGKVAHKPWAIQGAEAEIQVNTVLEAAGVDLADAEPHFLSSPGTDCLAWPIIPIGVAEG